MWLHELNEYFNLILNLIAKLLKKSVVLKMKHYDSGCLLLW